MGYIELSTTVPSTNRAIISLWFRVPGSTLAAATAAAQEVDSQNRTPMQGIVPLMVFGPDAINKGVGADEVVVGSTATATFLNCDGFGDPITNPGEPVTSPKPIFDSSKNKPIDPSYIGIDCYGTYPALSVNIVMPSGNKPSVAEYTTTYNSAFAFDPGAITLYGGSGGEGPCPDGFFYVNSAGFTQFCFIGSFMEFSVIEDFTSADEFNLLSRPETFRTLPLPQTFDANNVNGAGSSLFTGGIQIKPDHWHHLLLSFDLSDSCTTHGSLIEQVITGELSGYVGTTVETGDPAPNSEGSRTTSASKMWVALDDVNYTGNALSAYYPSGYADKNAVLTVNGFTCASSISVNSNVSGDDCQGNHTSNISIGHLPQYSYSPANVPFGAAPVGLPSTAEHVDSVLHVEMGELQMFVDVAMDTGSTGNRRAFITDKGTPASVSESEKLLGRKADVILHGSGNWKKGRNTGALADKPASDGTFVGDIKTYKPNPSLNGKQGAAQ